MDHVTSRALDARAKTPVWVVLHGVNNDEIQIGPYRQVAIEVEMVGPSIRACMKDVVTREPILYSAGGWWFYQGDPYKQAFVRAVEPGET